jgi:hypothetical protein
LLDKPTHWLAIPEDRPKIRTICDKYSIWTLETCATTSSDEISLWDDEIDVKAGPLVDEMGGSTEFLPNQCMMAELK